MMAGMSQDPGTTSGEPASTATKLIRSIAWIVLVFIGLVLVVVTGGYDAMGSIQSRLAHQAMAYLVLGSWLLLALARPAWRPRTPLVPAVALTVSAYVLATLASQRPRLSLEPGLAGPALALAFLCLCTILGDPWFRRRLTNLVVTVVALVAVAYLAAVAFEWAVFYRLVGQLTLPPLRPSWTDLTFGSPNLVATFLLVLGPLAVAMLAKAVSPRRWPALLLTAGITLAVFLTGSRGAYLGAAVALILLIPLLAFRRAARLDLRRAIKAARQRPILLVPVLTAGLVVAAATPLLVYRFAQGGDTLRLDLWRASATILAEHPLLGGGPGTWVQLKVEANPPGTSNLILAHAHNLYIQAAAELGLVGLAALAVLAVIVARRLGAGIVRGPAGTHGVAASVGIAGFLGQSLVDNLVNLPYVCVLVMLPIAWVDGSLTAADRQAESAPTGPRDHGGRQDRDGLLRRRLEAALLAGTLVAMAAALPVLVRIDQAAAAQAAGDAALEKDPARALAAYSEAVERDPEFTLYQIQHAATLARLGRVGAARDELGRAVELDSVGINLISLASLDLAAGDPAAAREHLRLALQRAPDELAVLLNAGLLHERLGDRETALNLLAGALTVRPAAAGLSLLDDPARLDSKTAIVARARSLTTPEQAALILAYAGDPAQARTELAALPPSPTRDLYAAAADWLAGRLVDATARLEAILRRDPLDYRAAGWLAGILRAEGDARAGTYLRWARLVQGDVGPGIARDVTARLASIDESWFGVPGQYPWAVYVRAFGGNVLAPDLTLIGAP
jgi:O-antigen ligase/tetratricopeptide (TPR) repeat protein